MKFNLKGIFFIKKKKLKEHEYSLMLNISKTITVPFKNNNNK